MTVSPTARRASALAPLRQLSQCLLQSTAVVGCDVFCDLRPRMNLCICP